MPFVKPEEKNKTAKEVIKEAKQNLNTVERFLEDILKVQNDWEKNGVDLRQIDDSAKTDIGILGEKAWLGARRKKLEEFQKECEASRKEIEEIEKNWQK